MSSPRPTSTEFDDFYFVSDLVERRLPKPERWRFAEIERAIIDRVG